MYQMPHLYSSHFLYIFPKKKSSFIYILKKCLFKQENLYVWEMFSSITRDSNILLVKINNKYVLFFFSFLRNNNKYVLGVQMYAKIIN